MTDSQPAQGASDSATGLELFLLALRYKEGQLLSLEANNPFLLDDPATCYIVYTGKVDVFAVRLRAGQFIAPRRHMLRAEVGDLLFGFERSEDGQGVGLLASGVPGTKVLRLKHTRLRQLAGEIEYQAVLSALLDRWVNNLSRAVARDVPPKDVIHLDAGKPTALKLHNSVMPRHGVLWIKQLAGSSQWMGRDDLPPLGGEGYIPLSVYTWARAAQPGQVAALGTAPLLEQNNVWAGLADFHSLMLLALTRNVLVEETSERERLQRKADSQALVIENAVAQIASLLEPQAATPFARQPGPLNDPLLAACQLVGQALRIEIRPPAGSQASRSQQSAIRQIAKASNIRVRQVTLAGEWWRDDNGPLVALVEATGRPVALLQTTPRSYMLHDPTTQASTPVTPQVAASLATSCYTFYRTLPRTMLSLWDLLGFGARQSRDDLLMVVGMGLAAGLLAMVVPIATGVIFDRLIPESQRGQLLIIGLVLLAIALSTMLFQITRSIAMLRIEGKITGALQAALWDRLLSLPVPFFRNYSAGDLGLRVMGITAIQQVISGPVITSILSGVFSVFNLLLLFFYDRVLAVVATALVLIAVFATTLAGYLQVRYQRELTEIEGRISGTVLQFLNGIAKFRVAGAQHHAFATWVNQFSQQRRLAYRARNVANGLAVFNAVYPVITSLVIFATVAASIERGLSTGQFLAFNAAFAQLLAAALQLSGAFIAILTIVPIYERAKPILQTIPEVTQAKADPGTLAGALEINHVSFRYKEHGPLVLKDISLQIQAGQFVALVGPSGSGKSSLLRLLLGFETPETGAIYYDGQDLNGLDLESVRQQIGVVLQNGRLMSGLLLQNIIGASLLTVDDAWEAARMAGLDEDIKRMPMGMFTVISEGAGTLSGGQRQRLMIARAIANKPRIIIFDEATSALDNRTQEIVSQSLETLQATRIVIAHRLSTISNADKIFVIDEGRIVQIGTYNELIAQPGLFAELARRQTI